VSRFFPTLLLLICAVLIAGTFYLLLMDRFESGDVYPPSSSLRSDPLGTMIFFESLQGLPGVRLDRDHSTVNRLPSGDHTTYLHFAAKSSEWRMIPTDLYKTIDRFLLEGGRLVITLTPEYGDSERPKDDEKEEPEKEASEKKTKKAKKEDKATTPGLVDLREKWGLKFSTQTSNASENTAKNISPLPLPPTLKWNGNVTLKDQDSSWKVIYQNDLGPVLAEKKRGPGSIVIATDSYFVSNEALVRDRHPELLAWLVGPANHIVFDESHFGITESPGIAALARKYRLHGGVAALLILAGLFIWKNSSPLVPRANARRPTDVLEGRAAGAGFVNLLRRNIPAEQVLAVCLDEWRKSFTRGTRFTPAEKAAVEAIAREEEARPARERDPVSAYQRIAAVLRRHNYPNA